MKNLLDTRTRTKFKRSESEIHVWFVCEFLPGLSKISVKYIQKHSQAIDPPSYSTCNKCWGWLSISTRLLGCNALAGVDQSTAFMDITFSKKGGGFCTLFTKNNISIARSNDFVTSEENYYKSSTHNCDAMQFLHKQLFSISLSLQIQ